jgi:LCP family protein required for cell wall assembly
MNGTILNLQSTYCAVRRAGLIAVMCACLIFGSAAAAQDGAASADTPPPAVPVYSLNGRNVTQFLLLGSDTANDRNAGRTDVMVVVAVDYDAGTVSMLSIPRDLYVHIPGHTAYRVNSAFGYGEQEAEGSGYALLIETLRYNLGLDIDYYARVNFNGFQRIIDDLGGVDIAVDCGIQDWRLASPELDPALEASWQMFTMPVGLHQFDGATALWYARSRRTSSDFDRGRRHQVLLRAVWQRVRALDLFRQIGDIYPQVLETVETNIPADVMIGLAAMAQQIDTARIASYTFRPNIEVRSWRSPEGSSVQVIEREAADRLIAQFFQPPTQSQLVQEEARIEIVNATGVADMAFVAAERLAWEGFTPTIADASAQPRQVTHLYDLTGQTKGSSVERLAAILRVEPEGVTRDPQTDRDVDFCVVLGSSYYACTHNVLPPTAGEGG